MDNLLTTIPDSQKTGLKRAESSDPRSGATQLVLTSETPRKFSRDEMNLAEFPLTVLSTRSNPNLKTLEFRDTVRGKNGEVTERRWIITGADKFGLPTASDDEVLLGLLKLTVDEGMRERKVYFTRYELLKALKWTTEGRSYSRLQKALDRLSGVRIKASNAFFDNENKVHSTKNFGIIDAYEINNGRDPHARTGFFTWSEVLFKSFQVGFIKKLDLDFYLDLKSAVSKRLYRYLDKHFWYKSRVQIDLFTLAHEKVGVSRNYQYASSIRQILDPAMEELIAAGFLSRCEYVGKGKSTEVVLTAGRQKPRSISQNSNQNISAADAVAEGEGEGSTRDQLLEALVMRGLKEPQVIKLITGRSEDKLNRMLQIVSYYDFLISSNSRLISRSPVGFLYRAMENPEVFVLPGEAAKRPSQESLGLVQQISTPKPDQKQKSESFESEYLIARKREISKIRDSIEPDLLSRITKEVEGALQKLKSLISPQRFGEAISHGVDEKLAKLFAVPSFEEWVRSASR